MPYMVILYRFSSACTIVALFKRRLLTVAAYLGWEIYHVIASIWMLADACYEVDASRFLGPVCYEDQDFRCSGR
ncbi:hypothetical protein BO94DRAFT_26698 [Aspergillus sclerotioniger CBS 115572]|uniref:Uncharacterized protein n=1 Tax=Aspergillus sclerotioniger CBS 115572 TaxID=1450535 RepID=A0A317X1R6_9EURO|nr:hypothetical protein BO94DRAFT_26698 [Aspergillus sclerotioniger CBS 115572]PWY90490.1 hypothetical protein BO94DRAFT_26698 [Aspergillus sclerotioniger CBS 115572]